LASAPRVFTKTLKPAIELLRELGILLVIYMDDMLLLANSRSVLVEHIYTAMYVLENLGFVINKPKSLLQPTLSLEYLGMIINSITIELSLPCRKIKAI